MREKEQFCGFSFLTAVRSYHWISPFLFSQLPPGGSGWAGRAIPSPGGSGWELKGYISSFWQIRRGFSSIRRWAVAGE